MKKASPIHVTRKTQAHIHTRVHVHTHAIERELGFN